MLCSKNNKIKFSIGAVYKKDGKLIIDLGTEPRTDNHIVLYMNRDEAKELRNALTLILNQSIPEAHNEQP